MLLLQRCSGTGQCKDSFLTESVCVLVFYFVGYVPYAMNSEL